MKIQNFADIIWIHTANNCKGVGIKNIYNQPS